MPLQTLDADVSFVQSDTLYRPTSLALRITNMMLTDAPGNTLRSGGQTSPYEAQASGLSAYMSGMAICDSLGGANHVVAFKSGSALYVHEGWNRAYTTVVSGLTYDLSQPYPDSMVAINGRIVWSNGIDQPRVIDGSMTYGRLVTPLGFDRAPGAPTVLCPNAGAEQEEGVANYYGYSHVGGIGTVQSFEGEDGALLAGRWKYRVMWEDAFGNMSPASAETAAWITNASAGYLPSTSADYKRLNHMDSLTRMFCVRGMSPGENHVVAHHVYRTLDQLNNPDRNYYLVCRVDGNERFTVPDGESDGVLAGSMVMPDITPVRPHRIAAVYQGRLVVGNFPEAPALVRWSEPGFVGTFNTNDYAIPAEGGAEITGLVAWGDAVIVFTDRSIYALTLDPTPSVRPLFNGVGCAAPCSIQTLPDGRLIWQSRMGFYAMSPGAAPERISDPISRRIGLLPVGFVGRTVSAIDPLTGVYIASVCSGTTPVNNLLLCYDPRAGGWVESDAGGWHVTAMAATPGHQSHVIMGAYYSGLGVNLRVWNRTSNILAPASASATYESGVIRMDDAGVVPFRVRSIIIEYVETSVKDGGSATLSVYPDDDPQSTPVDYAVDLCRQEADATWPYGGATVATTSKFRQPLIRSRKVDVDLNTKNGFRFKLTVTGGIRMELIGFRFILEAQNNTKSSRTPGATRKS